MEFFDEVAIVLALEDPVILVRETSRASLDRYYGTIKNVLTPAPTSEQPDVTQLLLRMEHGDRHATDLLLPVVYRELRRLAAGYLQRERGSHTLQPTALVHEAYMRMVDQSRVQWQNRAHFFGVAAQMMRRVLVDHARSQGASKRGGDVEKTPLSEDLVASSERNSELIAIDDALTALEQFDPVKAKVVELRFFGGLSIEETAAATGVSVATVNRQWRMAKAWLFAQLQKDREK